jgi:hypothetical protein
VLHKSKNNNKQTKPTDGRTDEPTKAQSKKEVVRERLERERSIKEGERVKWENER